MAQAADILNSAPTKLRLRPLDSNERERHASWLELFFDLVFVLAVAQVVPESQMVALQFGNVDLTTIDPAELKGRLFVEISREPGIKFVWGGISIAVIGGLLALVRRWREAQIAAGAPSTALPEPKRPMPTPALQPGLTSAQIESETAV